MRVLVTGAAGFIGSTLVDELLQTNGIEVRGVDCLTDYYDLELKQRNLDSARKRGFELIHGDLNEVDLDRLLDGVDVVFHQAGQPGVRPSWGESFSRYIDANIAATQRLLESARRTTTLKRFVYASSSSVYGDAETYPTHENALPRPLSPYGVTKLAAEHLAVLYAKNFGVPTVSLRYFTVYGPRQRPDMAFTRFIKSALRGEKITVFGDGHQLRDFTFVRDIVRANIAAATAEIPPGTVMNVSGGGSHSVREAIELIAQATERDVTVSYGEAALGDVRRTGGDSSLARRLLNWQPQVDLASGLALQAEWLSRGELSSP